MRASELLKRTLEDFHIGVWGWRLSHSCQHLLHGVRRLSWYLCTVPRARNLALMRSHAFNPEKVTTARRKDARTAATF
jgi:hypothetical protein